MPFSISSQDVIYAALLAVLFTWLIKTVAHVFKVVIGRTTEFNYHPKNLDAVLERCCSMFPNENVRFNGLDFTRGTLVRVITINNKIFEGKLIGSNKDNIVCVVTNHSVVAQEMDDIEEMETV